MVLIVLGSESRVVWAELLDSVSEPQINFQKTEYPLSLFVSELLDKNNRRISENVILRGEELHFLVMGHVCCSDENVEDNFDNQESDVVENADHLIGESLVNNHLWLGLNFWALSSSYSRPLI